MGRGGYNGGSTIIGPGSGWFGYGRRRAKDSECAPFIEPPAKPKRKTRKQRLAELKDAAKKARQDLMNSDPIFSKISIPTPLYGLYPRVSII